MSPKLYRQTDNKPKKTYQTTAHPVPSKIINTAIASKCSKIEQVKTANNSSSGDFPLFAFSASLSSVPVKENVIEYAVKERARAALRYATYRSTFPASTLNSNRKAIVSTTIPTKKYPIPRHNPNAMNMSLITLIGPTSIDPIFD